jgi:hypothetical protein
MGDVEPPRVPEELDEHELNRLIGEGQIPNIQYENQQRLFFQKNSNHTNQHNILQKRDERDLTTIS